MAENPRKLYYSIKEVAQQINVTESLLRYWETEFPHLRPKTTGNRVRQYTEKDIEQIKVIYTLSRCVALRLLQLARCCRRTEVVLTRVRR